MKANNQKEKMQRFNKLIVAQNGYSNLSQYSGKINSLFF